MGFSWLNSKEIEKFLGAFGKGEEEKKLFCQFSLETGMRVGEILGHRQTYKSNGSEKISILEPFVPINIMHNDEEDCDFIRVIGKGSKTRIVPFDAISDDIIDFINQRKIRENQKVFKFSVSTAQSLCKKKSKEAGIKHVHPHMFRHTYAINYLMEGGNIRSLQMILGHDRLSTTAKYLKMADTLVFRDYKRTKASSKRSLDVKSGKCKVCNNPASKAVLVGDSITLLCKSCYRRLE